MKPIFGRAPSLQWRLLLAVIISLVLIIGDSRSGYFNEARTWLSTVVSPLQYAANTPRLLLDGLVKQFKSRQQLQEENQQLKKNQFLLQEQLLQLSDLQHENQRLRQLLKAPMPKPYPEKMAEIMSVVSDPFSQQVVINRGLLDGVYQGQPVLNDQGIVGQVLHVGTNTSRVLLISDPSHSIPVRVQRNDERAIVSGTGEPDSLVLNNIPRSTDIKAGDLLVSSGLGGRFPEGIPVARVTLFQYIEGRAFARVEAKPVADLSRLHYLLLVWPKELSDAQKSHPQTGGKQ
ncbi:rod shape-determining protein MreC [Dongshaea marina]|uniref:rod shape-determining protein MreC n=1 Tax=Dongshaea marina TaxID=2047966 RepID=UPI000D3EDC61|nr:rod shape-determining protein MreC [Dongshaea marina]